MLVVEKIAVSEDKNLFLRYLKDLQILLGKEGDSYKEILFKIDWYQYDINHICERARKEGMSAPEISRLQQYISMIHFAFEKLLAVKEVRTPIALKLFIYLTLPLSTLILAPAFAILWYFWLIVSIIVTFLLSLLLTIQNDIENPFGEDIDDIRFDFIWRFQERLDNIW